MTNSLPILAFSVIGVGSEWFWAALQFLVIAVTIPFIYRQLSLQNSAHVVSVLATLDSQWNSELMLVSRVRWCEKLRAVYRGLPASQTLRHVCVPLDGHGETIADFLEDLALHSRKRTIPQDMIWHAYSWQAGYYWRMLEAGVAQMRQQFRNNELYCELPTLIDSIEEENLRRRLPGFESITKDDMVMFLDREITSLKELTQKPPE